MKKIIALLLAVLMLVSLVACTKAPADTTTEGKTNVDNTTAAADDTTAAAGNDIITVKWATVDGKPTNYDAWIKIVNDYIGEKIGVNVEMIYADGETLALMYQTGADYDIMFGEGGSRIEDAYKVGAAADITDLLAHVPALTDLIPSYVFDAVTMDGKIVGVPAYKDYSHSEYFIWEKAVVDEYYPEYTEVHTLQDMYEAVKAIKEAGCDWQSLYMAGGFSNGIPNWDYDAVNGCGFVGINFNGGTEYVAIYEQPEVQANYETIAKLYAEGYINNDNYVLDSTNDFNQYVVGNGWGWPSAAETAWKRDGRPVVVSQYMYTTASTSSIRGSYLFFNSQSTEEELIAALKLVEFLNTDTYLRDLYWYGEPGYNWEYVDENGEQKVKKYTADDGIEAWTMAAYRQGSFFNVTPELGSLGYKEIQTLNENAKPSPAMGFVYVPSAEMEDVILNLNSIWEQYSTMISCGVDYSLLAVANQELRDAGIQDVIDEVNAQFTAWKAAQG